MTDQVTFGGRQSAVLRAVVIDHIRTGEPVGSGTVARRHRLGVSAATIRNDMAALEVLGYLAQPHTSAGRIPTDLGYRFYVDTLPARPTLAPTHRRAIAAFFGEVPSDVEEILRRTTSLLSRLTRHAAVAVSPVLSASRVVRAELVPFGTAALLLVVGDTGRVEKRVIELPEGATEETTAAASAVLAGSVAGVTFRDAGRLAEGLAAGSGDPQRSLLAAAAEALSELGEASEHVFLGGVANIARDRSFRRRETVRRMFEALEEEAAFERFLRRVLTGSEVAVRIGHENPLAAMREASVVVAPYLVAGRPAGEVAVIGPTRMEYPTAISTVWAVATRLSRTIETLAG
jgi:heat-inducible transcriptional repressor